MAYTEFYCRSGVGSNLNAGSTTSATPAHEYASGDWVAATGVFTVASGDPQAAGVAVGMFASVYPDGSTTGVFVGRITAVDTTTITVSLTAKGGSAPTDGTGNRTIRVGGAWNGPTGAVTFPFALLSSALNDGTNYPRVNMQGTFDTSAAVSTAMFANGPCHIEGYTTTAGDGGYATIRGAATGAGYTLLTLGVTASRWSAERLIFTRNGDSAGGTTNGLSIAGGYAKNCIAHDLRGHGITTSSGPLIECEAYACCQAASADTAGLRCNSAGGWRLYAHENGVDGIHSSAGLVVDSISHDNTGRGFFASATGVAFRGCDAYANGSHGFELANSNTRYELENCNALANGGYGIRAAGSTTWARMQSCGFGAGTMANASGATSANGSLVWEEYNIVTYPSNVTPWVDPDDGDFRVVHADAKNAGRGAFLQTSPLAGTVSYPNIGACQHTPDYPDESDVADGVTYDNGDRVGTLVAVLVGILGGGLLLALSIGLA